MRVCDQFTDAYIGRFFVPMNQEAEVHSSVDLSRTPSAVGLGVDLPVVIIGSEKGKIRGANPLTIDDGVGLTQGEKVVGIQSYWSVNDQVPYAPRHLREEDLSEFGTDLGVSPDSLADLTHTVVEIDWMTAPRRRNESKVTEFETSGTAILPIDEPIPYMGEEYDRSETFIVKGFINRKNEMVKWTSARNSARWLIDLCVLNTYAHNRVELAMLQYALGHESALTGLVSVNRDVGTYLRNFDESARSHGGLTYTPTAEPTRYGYEKKFPPMTHKEREVWERQINASYQSLSTSDRSKLK